MIQSNNSLQNQTIIEQYFEAFSQGDMEKVMRSFHPDCLIVSVREEEDRPQQQLHGTYRTSAEVPQFLSNIMRLFTPKVFEVKQITAGTNQEVFAYGSFIHESNVTGKLFKSDWVQYCIVEDGKIKEYRFFEDSQAFQAATQE